MKNHTHIKHPYVKNHTYIKKILAMISAAAITVTAISSSISFVAVAADTNIPTSGKCGDNIDWLINSDGVLVISGNGEMKRPTDNWGWAKLNNNVKEVVIENGITSTASDTLICPFGYNYCRNISKIILPPSFIKLKKTLETVNNLKNLKDIYIYSRNVTDTAYQAYYYPGGIIWHVYKDSDTERSLRNDLKLTDEDIEYIPDNEQMPTVSNKTPVELEPVTETSGPCGLLSKYEYNESSKTLTFSGKGEISIADNYQKYAKETEHIVIESGITKIFAYTGVQLQERITGAFYGFTSLKDVKLPDTLTEIGELSFYETPLANINFPEGLEQIETLAFYKTNLEDISFPNSLKKIGESAFNNSKIKSINLHEGMTLGGAAFYSCESLKEVTIPKNTTLKRVEIGVQGMSREPNTFGNCTGLEKIIIEDGSWLGDSWENEITPNGIPDNFCQLCSSLKTVIIKGDVEYISSRAFGSCTKLADIYLYNTGLTTITAKGSHAVNNDNLNDPVYWIDSFWTGNDPTFHVVKGSITEQTMRNAGYLTADNTEYLTDFTALDEKIKEAESLDTSKYTDNSVATLKSAIESGKTVLANENATQEQVDSAVATIENAIKALKSKVSPAKPTSAPTTRNPETVKKDKAAAENLMQQAKIIKLKVKSKAKKKITVSWKKVKNAVGYQVQVSNKKNFKKNKIIFNKFTSKKKLTISKKIKSKKTYFVRVRAYATYKDTYGKPQKVYSKWNNKLRKVKVK